MAIYPGTGILKEIFYGNVRIIEARLGSVLLWQYDKTAPVLTVTAPVSTSSGAPDYSTSGTTYRVSGTVSDTESGVAAVYVNGAAAVLGVNGTWYRDITLTADSTATVQVYAVDNAGNQTSVITRYVMYDSTVPGLAVTAPTGTSSSSPTYVAAASYTVSGTASDAGSGLKSVTVNGKAATINGNNWSCAVTLTADAATTITVVATDNAGRTTTVTRYAFYESANPTVAVTAPTGTSSSSPTYYQSDSAVNYKVYGTASAKSGIKSVTVGGAAATDTTSWSYTSSRATNTTHTITIVVTSNAGRTTTVTRYLRVEAYYQQAARTAGTTVQASLANTLTNSTVCTAIAGNATAYEIMAAHYKSDMTSYIDSNFSDALNLLNFRCKAKCYLYKSGNYCTNIWSNAWTGGRVSGDDAGSWAKNSDHLWIDCSSASGWVVYNNTAINLGGFAKLNFYYYGAGIYSSASGAVGCNSASGLNETYTEKSAMSINGQIQTAAVAVNTMASRYIKFNGFAIKIKVYSIYLT